MRKKTSKLGPILIVLGGLIWLSGLVLVGLATSQAAAPPGNQNFIPLPTVLTDDIINNGNCTLREAIIAANTNTQVDQCLAGQPGLDTIQLQSGTYQLSLAGASEDATATGDLDITEALTIIGQGASTIIDGGALDRVFDLPQPTNPTVTFSNLTIRNGKDTNQSGGGLFIPFFSTSTTHLSNVTVISNTGYGVHSVGTMTLNQVNILNNSNTGLYATGNALSPVSVLSSTIQGNSAGGIFIVNSGRVNLSNSAILSNTNGGDGGGIAVVSAITQSLSIVNSTISGNKTNGNGGGLYNSFGTTTVNNVTIANNTADNEADGTGDGGGVFNTAGGAINVKNSIIAGNLDNSAVTKHPDCSGILTSQGYNLIQNITGCTVSPTNNLLGQNPLLGPLTGSPAYHPIVKTSPAFDAGNPAAPGSGGDACAATDQRGIPRPQGVHCDIGAMEFAVATLTISKTAPFTATASQQITYTLTVFNTGDEAASAVSVTDTLPTGANFVKALDGGILIANQVVWPVGSLAAKTSTPVRFVVTAKQTIVNNTYGATGNGGLTASGSPVTTTIEGSVIYLPIVLK